MLRFMFRSILVVAFVACGGAREPDPPSPSHTEPERRFAHGQMPCDDFNQVQVAVKTEGDAIVFEKTEASHHCATNGPQTTVTELGRIRAQKTAACPVGEIAYRSWSGGQGFEAKLAEIEKALDSEARAYLHNTLFEQSHDTPVVAYVLGCGKTYDFVLVQERDAKTMFWVGNKLVPTDARFVAR